MFTLRRHLRQFTWVALLAIFGLALAPTISHALAAAQGQQSSLAQICTPQGTKTLVVAADGSVELLESQSGSDEGFANPLEHCPLCGLAAAAPPLPATEPVLVLPLTQSTAVPRLFLLAPRPLFTWSAAQPRAPPAGA